MARFGINAQKTYFFAAYWIDSGAAEASNNVNLQWKITKKAMSSVKNRIWRQRREPHKLSKKINKYKLYQLGHTGMKNKLCKKKSLE